MIDINKKYTSNGRPIRIICVDRDHPRKSVIGLYRDQSDGYEYYIGFTKEGKHFADNTQYDLVEVTETI